MGDSPNWSWDGRQLLYYSNDHGLWIDSKFDGTRPFHIPLAEDYDTSPTWSPDSTRIAYTTWAGVKYEIWLVDSDGSNRHLFLGSDTVDIESPSWSPDGAWMAYARCCDPSKNYLWLIRLDGTQDHPLQPLVTGVAGYPGYALTWLSTACWSPDARRLAVNFSADGPGGASISGIGVISRDGGVLTPAFLAPPGVVCCAAPSVRGWSPDGTGILFVSAHHLPVDPHWSNKKFEPGVELWLIAADGSGPPTRLTYDFMWEDTVAWLAPNTPVGSAVPITKGDATLTYTTVSGAGSTALSVTSGSPGPAP